MASGRLRGGVDDKHQHRLGCTRSEETARRRTHPPYRYPLKRSLAVVASSMLPSSTTPEPLLRPCSNRTSALLTVPHVANSSTRSSFEVDQGSCARGERGRGQKRLDDAALDMARGEGGRRTHVAHKELLRRRQHVADARRRARRQPSKRARTHARGRAIPACAKPARRRRAVRAVSSRRTKARRHAAERSGAAEAAAPAKATAKAAAGAAEAAARTAGKGEREAVVTDLEDRLVPADVEREAVVHVCEGTKSRCQRSLRLKQRTSSRSPTWTSAEHETGETRDAPMAVWASCCVSKMTVPVPECEPSGFILTSARMMLPAARNRSLRSCQPTVKGSCERASERSVSASS